MSKDKINEVQSGPDVPPDQEQPQIIYDDFIVQ